MQRRALKLLDLRPQSVADFYGRVMAALRELKIEIKIWTMPVEIPDPIPLKTTPYTLLTMPNMQIVSWRALLKMDPVFQEFRARFIGKVSPVHFFWAALMWQ